MKTIKVIATVVLGIASLAIFNEGESFMPNLFGLFCLALLVAINVPADACHQLKDRF